MLIILILTLSLSVNSRETTDSTGKLIVNVYKLEGKDGLLRISVYNNEQGFPSEWEKSLVHKSVKIDSSEMTVVFDSLAAGSYSVAVLHDANENSKMDTNWLGMPKEGVGISNDAKGMFGPPDFEDALFEHTNDSTEIIINMAYL